MNAPVKKIRIGMMHASIWRQDTDGTPMYNTTFGRSYKQGNQWKDSASFGVDVLGTISVLATLAAAWIAAQVERDRQRQQNGGPDDGQAQGMDRTGGQVGGTNRGPGGGNPRGNGNGGGKGMQRQPSYDEPTDEPFPPY